MQFEGSCGIVNTGDEVLPPGPAADFISEFASVSKRLRLVPVRPKAWYYWLEVVFRFCGVVLGIVTLGLILPLPIVLLRVLDGLLMRMGKTAT
jgi:hypothetical protein